MPRNLLLAALSIVIAIETMMLVSGHDLHRVDANLAQPARSEQPGSRRDIEEILVRLEEIASEHRLLRQSIKELVAADRSAESGGRKDSLARRSGNVDRHTDDVDAWSEADASAWEQFDEATSSGVLNREDMNILGSMLDTLPAEQRAQMLDEFALRMANGDIVLTPGT